MNYKLAKQLKDAGFPFRKGLGCKRFVNENGEQFNYGQIPPNMKNEEIPTLSELIDACGDGFWKMENQYGRWGVIGRDYKVLISVSGKTPEEAVAKLWLKLNKV